MLKDYHSDIIDIILKRINENQKEIFINMAPGTGKIQLIKKFIETLDNSKKVLILTNKLEINRQYDKELRNFTNIEINNYIDNLNNNVFSYVILDNSERLPEEKYKKIYSYFDKANLIFFCDTNQLIKNDNNWLKNKKMDYIFTIQQAIENGYINPKVTGFKFECVIEEILKSVNFGIIEKDVLLHSKNGAFRPDFIIKNKNKVFIVETKFYRNEYIQIDFIKRCVEQVEYYKKIYEELKQEKSEIILIMSCHIPEEIKRVYYQENKILIVDISNLLYLCQDHENLIKLLIESIDYDIHHIKPIPLLLPELFKIDDKNNINKLIEESNRAKTFIKKLETLSYGKDVNADKKYEKLCTDIIKYLFEQEFTKMSEQNITGDEMFKMDMVCGLKGNSEFWKILIQHYNTRFVVFEFKNYEGEIKQNNIYITEKYLYNAVLRNVAIIISRKGFSFNAKKAATGILTETGKLIIGLNDSDLINMLRMKFDGEEASDYLLNLLEDYLMSVSK